MKKLTSLILSLALGMSALPSLSSAYASNSTYDPNDLYNQFLQQLQQQDQSGSQNDVQTDIQPTLISEPVPTSVEPAPAVQAQPTSFVNGTLTISGRIVTDGKNYYLETDQGPTAKVEGMLLLTSGNKELNAMILRAAGNDEENHVQITGLSVDRDYDEVIDGVSLNDGAVLKNLKNPANPNFEKKKVEAPKGLDRSYRQYYGEFRIEPANQRAYVWMTNEQGQPLDRNGNVITSAQDAENSNIRDVRIAYNESSETLNGGKTMWEQIFELGRRYNDLDTVFVNVGFLGFIGTEQSGARYAHVGLITLIREIVSQVSPGSPDEVAPRAAMPSIDYTAPVAAGTFTLTATPGPDNCGHHPFILLSSVRVSFTGNQYTLTGTNTATGTSFTLTGTYNDPVLGASTGSGSVAGFANVSISFANGKLTLGVNGDLPGGCPIVYTLN